MTTVVGAPHILLAGGGSGGSATPVIAVAQRLRELSPEARLLLVGTKAGPERRLATAAGITFEAVASGKLRRYWSWTNVIDPARVVAGVAMSARLVRRFGPQAALGAGGSASVPPLAAAALLGVPVHIHQQDAEPGLANRLLKPLARSCSVSLAASLPRFPPNKTMLVGNPVRASILDGDADRARRTFELERDVPLLLATGGGTGALGLNRLVAAAAAALVEHCQIVHLTGVGRGVPVSTPLPRYRQLEFVTTEMADLLAAATLVLSRAGMGILAELAAVGKPTVLVPMPDSHQAANAAAFVEQRAAVALEERKLSGEHLARVLVELLSAPQRLADLGRNMRDSMPRDAAERLARRILELAETS
jgi:UDP-N-acetylglucosamine--N-acetylmuramyl-(pentapeptide) pyrophosphoryl-undecaprenol N-acetylglucosamine transferase